ncbi:MAG TPA: DUF2946 family protein [Trinickia sp.]|nr:DUF2946 family protein [Trinickia sp.]
MPHHYRRLTAWLGILAICFAIAVPLASQWRASMSAEFTAIVCSADQPNSTPNAHHAQDVLDRCGYCSFFSHIPAIDGAAKAEIHSRAVFVYTSVPQLFGAAPSPRYPRARPRAPPALA